MGTYSIHWVDTIAVTSNSQKSSTYTPRWIELSIDSTSVPSYQLSPTSSPPSIRAEEIRMDMGTDLAREVMPL